MDHRLHISQSRFVLRAHFGMVWCREDMPQLCANSRAPCHRYYSQTLPSGKDVAVLDVCSSWISHYPQGYTAGKITGCDAAASAPELTAACKSCTAVFQASARCVLNQFACAARGRLGMNRDELQRNPVLMDFDVKDLNVDPKLPYDDNTYDVSQLSMQCHANALYSTVYSQRAP